MPRANDAALLLDDNVDARVILHFDLDCFYASCERELNPALRGVPLAVSQYNPYGDLKDKALPHERWIVKGGAASTTTTTNPQSLSSSSPSRSQQQQQQENTNGSLIAVSYEARASGVKRNQRGKEACRACPQLHIVQVPVKHGKADLTLYRTASKRVMEILQKGIKEAANEILENKTTTMCDEALSQMMTVEIASIDEVYMDVTKLANRLMERITQGKGDNTLWQRMIGTAGNCTTIGGVEVLSKAALATNALAKDELRRGSHVQVLDNKVDAGSREWWDRHLSSFSVIQLRLVCGAYLAAQARAIVESSFDGGVFTLSAGISTNKTLAKLASGLKKPNRQTLIYRDARVLQKLFHPLPLGRIRGLGGKFGDAIASQLQIETVGQLAEIPLPQLQQVSKSAQFLYDISRGLCTDEVTPRNKPKSIECSKTFRGHLSIPTNDKAKLEKWMGELCSELIERLQSDKDEYNRVASTIKVSVQFHHQRTFLSKQMRAPRSLQAYPKTALEMIQNLIECIHQKKSVSTPESKNLKITALGIGGSQFVDIAEGSSSILSFATQGASSTKSTTAGISTKAPKRPLVEDKPSGVKLWLQQGQNDATKPQQTGQAKRPKAAHPSTSSSGTLLQQMTTGKKPTKPTRMNTSTEPAIAMPSMDEIDPEVLKALPKDLQRAVLGDIRYQQSQSQAKGKRGIKSFFEPRQAR